ncbi:GNAT family N-acetyltransferase [Biomphalaria pfeifferi]|uniref:GNAT family N-acetyltransferase n=1 Tax=Biomphalaria pfeifferi TaxID=112525 RepID=A0AAD8ANB8_BIOPF|nr:GNAT family N-acetyltransferase [Biomphalaria pfeifferi]
MMQENYIIRELREKDIGEWLRLRKLLWDGVSEAEHKSEMLDIYEHSETQLVLVAEVGENRLIGFLEASIRPFVEDCHSDHVGYLEGWFVEPEFRKTRDRAEIGCRSGKLGAEERRDGNGFGCRDRKRNEFTGARQTRLSGNFAPRSS